MPAQSEPLKRRAETVDALAALRRGRTGRRGHAPKVQIRADNPLFLAPAAHSAHRTYYGHLSTGSEPQNQKVKFFIGL